MWRQIAGGAATANEKGNMFATCKNDGECTGDNICFKGGNTFGFCTRSCATHPDCITDDPDYGSKCVNDDGQNICYPYTCKHTSDGNVEKWKEVALKANITDAEKKDFQLCFDVGDACPAPNASKTRSTYSGANEVSQNYCAYVPPPSSITPVSSSGEADTGWSILWLFIACILCVLCYFALKYGATYLGAKQAVKELSNNNNKKAVKELSNNNNKN